MKFITKTVKLDFYCSLRAARLSAKYVAVRFYLDRFVSDNVEFCTSHTYTYTTESNVAR